MSCEKGCGTCASIRSATLQLVGDRGLSGVSIDALVDRTKLTPAQLRSHYPSVQACVHDTYERVSMDLLGIMADSFARSKSWSDALTSGVGRVLRRLVRRPAEARLCFVEVLRGDRELLWRRENMRRLTVELLTAEHNSRSDTERLSTMQHEMLVGASFQLISSRVEDGQIDALLDLGPELAELAGLFEPIAA
jgi:AcrR family transcriptional regulator